MAKNDKSAEELLGASAPAAGPQINMGVQGIAALVKAAVEAATTKQSEMFIQAIAEMRKPINDPKQALRDLNDKAFQDTDREIQQRIRENMKVAQSNCPHKQGCNPLSEFQSPLSSFVTHVLDTGLVWGICTYCQKQIYSDRPEDYKFFMDKSANRRSQAGQRQFRDQAKAQKAGHPIGYDEEPTPAAVA